MSKGSTRNATVTDEQPETLTRLFSMQMFLNLECSLATAMTFK